MPLYEVVGVEDLNFEPNEVAFCDTETDGLYGELLLFQCYVATWDKVKIIHTPNKADLIAKLQTVRSVWYNASYDLSVLGCILNKFDDAMLLSMLALPNIFKYSLDVVLLEVLGYDPYVKNNINKASMQNSKWEEPTEEQYLYASIDVYYLPEVFKVVKEYKNSNSYRLDKKSLITALKFEKNGMPINNRRLQIARKKLKEVIKEKELDFNVNSWKQTKEALKIDETSKITLMKLSLNGNDLAKKVLTNRANLKLLNFMDKYDTLKDSDNRIYGHFNPSARSGRFRCSHENLQQIPRNLKALFGFEDVSKVLIFSDYSQLELRTIASILNVKLMVKKFKAEEDLHMFTAKKIFGEQATKEQRHLAKTYNFNLLYGGSANMVSSILISQGINITSNQANRHKRKWLELYPEIDRWQQEQVFRWQEGKYGTTPFGRRYKAKLMTDQMNIMNQGAGADVAKLALVYIQQQLDKPKNKEIKLLNFVHDSYILEAPNTNEDINQAVTIVGESMVASWRSMSKYYKVKDMPMPVEVLVGFNWGDIEKGKFIYDKTFN